MFVVQEQKNLAVFYQSPSKEIIETAKIWFDNNIIDLDLKKNSTLSSGVSIFMLVLLVVLLLVLERLLQF